ncbi:MAG TPA: alpha/beta hydrolase fold domain-containing protein, partial [Amycolatopsis sp.]|nr:alpha/beta hydrolase fold domain-containing protein [Amycolatopsis sp.]
MPLDEAVRAYLAAAGDTGFPAEALTDPARAAAYLAAARAPRPARTGDPVGRVEDRTLDGDVRARLYFPDGERPFPAVLFLHGGGWVLGDLDFQDHVCRRLCRDTGAVVVSVDYRLAPEHRYPAALDDAETAGNWLRAHAAGIGCDPDALAVFGSSAGGNLAAALTLRDRAANRAPFALQVL